MIEFSSEDGMTCPFSAVVETLEFENAIRIINTASLEFPFAATVESHLLKPEMDNFDSDGDFLLVVVDIACPGSRMWRLDR